MLVNDNKQKLTFETADSAKQQRQKLSQIADVLIFSHLTLLGLPLETGSRSDYSHPTHLPRKIPGRVGCGGRTLCVLPPLEKARSGWVRCMFPLVDNPHSISLHAKLDKIVRGASVFFSIQAKLPTHFSLSFPSQIRAR